MVDTTRYAPQCRVEQKDQAMYIKIMRRFRHLCHQRWQRWRNPFALQIRKVFSAQGESYWQAFNPRTGHSFSSGSEADIRHWIEQQYRD